MRRLAALAAPLALVPLAITACTQSPTLASPRALNRPSAVAFVCFDAADMPVPLRECRAELDGTQREGFTLIALVPQQTRGEVAAIDVSSTPPRTLDSDRRVPGFTFVPAGEVPSAIAISETEPNCTWVANRGSRGITGIETRRFLEESLASAAATPAPELRLFVEDAGPIPDGGPDQDGGPTDAGEAPDADASAGDSGRPDAGRGAPLGPGMFQGRPQSMVLIERGPGDHELWVTLPEDSRIARVELDETACAATAVETIWVPSRLPLPPAGAPSDATLLPPAMQDAATLALCPEATALPLLGPIATDPIPLPEPDPVSSMPSEMIVERDAAGAPVALLIADLARPVIHRFDLTTRTFVGSIRTPAPVRDLALTPFVPDSAAPGAPASSRYLYAIDDSDGSVFVLSFPSGHLLPVAASSARRRDRIGFRSTARVIAAFDTGPIETDADVANDDFRRTDERCRSPVTEPRLLHGVFVAVGLSDGTLRIIDVLDRDALCRDEQPVESAPPGPCPPRFGLSETMSFVARHRPRIGARLTSSVQIDDPPSVSVGGASARYLETGMVGEGVLAPRLETISCPSGLGQVFPQPGTDARICAITDPWAAEPELWTLTWQGAIPGTATTRGNIEPIETSPGVLDQFTITTGTDLCSSGALPGDLLAITSPLPASTANDPGCRSLLGLDLRDTPRPVLLTIEAVGPSPVATSRSTIRVAAGSLAARVIACFAPSAAVEELVSFDVRVPGAFTVVGSRSGFRHRVRTGAGSPASCEIDPMGDPLANGRAIPGAEFVSSRIAFRLIDEVPIAARPDTVITFAVSQAPPGLAVDLGSTGGGARLGVLPSEVVWSETDRTLYAIDEVRRGLAIVRTRPRGADSLLRVEAFVE